MYPTQAPTILLSDYQEPAFWVDSVDLHFTLDPNATRVKSKITFRANETRIDGPHDLHLDGRQLKLIAASIDGTTLKTDEILTDAEGLTIPADLIPQNGFIWEAEVEINPAGNTALEGLYMSNGMYCTQCEAQGFRKITYYQDRPDVMAIFNVTIDGSEPVLLSNGNKNAHGEWTDPWVKPAYLFALVAGDLVSYDDTFTTMSGRHVDLQIFVRAGDQDKCAYAMDALKRSMTWDEEVYGREYDLDLFMIVAVDDFNMGAMENKGLNIFNSKYVLASPETATDRDFERIEGIIAHEYFHNWTGNRITCRDWFQLCLKEGLTVFRDQHFSGDQRSHAVKRIEDVLQLRARQFREDAGPLAHPCRPEEYIEINNFYTATVYEKGAEVIGMLKLLVGDAGYDKALELYFERHDGQACTIEHWIQVFEDACETDLTQFKLWYSQSGTPKVTVSEEYTDGLFSVTLTQDAAPSPNRVAKLPQVIPVRTGFIGADGSEILPQTVLELRETTQTFTFETNERPVLSLLRGFSAPVILERDIDAQTRAFLFANDTDTFNKWEAGRDIAMDLLVTAATGNAANNRNYISALHALATDETLDPAYRSLLLTLPSEEAIAQGVVDAGHAPNPAVIYTALRDLGRAIAQAMADDLPNLYHKMAVDGPYSPDATDSGKRALRGTALALMTKLDDGEAALLQFADADNMTEQLSALSLAIAAGVGDAPSAEFFEQWKSDTLVMDKWFAIQVASATPDVALQTAQKLAAHPDFNWKNPNRFRSLIGPFAMSPAAFHAADGSGYAFIADWLIKLDAINPQTTARMCGAFETWKRYDMKRQTLMTTQLRRIQTTLNLSKDASEIVGKILG
jgi:aminopeptidase N